MKFFKKWGAAIVSISIGIGVGIAAAVLPSVSMPIAIAIAIGIGVGIASMASNIGAVAIGYLIGKKETNESLSRVEARISSMENKILVDNQLKHEKEMTALDITNSAINSHDERSASNHNITNSMLRSSEKVSDTLANIGVYASTDQEPSKSRSTNNDDGVNEPARKPMRA